MKKLASKDSSSLYQLENTKVKTYIATTPESRQIVNDPFLVGVKYTEALKIACGKVVELMQSDPNCVLYSDNAENKTCVLNILRGGLNFGLREALAKSLNWNNHSAAFISAQRARQDSNPEDWYITESSYQKVFLPKDAIIVFGDVVATGTSLEFALSQILDIAKTQAHTISSFIFFTIGGPRSGEIIEKVNETASKLFPNFIGSTVIYLEGCFSVADTESPVTVKFTGTDLLRRESIVVPEFVKSQFENPTFPIERCTIYDAGSRAFWLPEYFEDIKDYWEQTLHLAKDGMTYEELLAERYPELLKEQNESIDFSKISLVELCEAQLAKLDY